MHIQRNRLLLVAGAVWGAAGVNILRIGLPAYPPYLSLPHVALSLAVFTAFQLGVFRPLVARHTARILGYPDEPQCILRFFDRKGFAVLAGMMAFGLGLRASGLVPARFFAVFYTGLGAALTLAGLHFWWRFCRIPRSVSPADEPKRDASPAEAHTAADVRMLFNPALAYAGLALIGGVFYREFTKYNGFQGRTALGLVHTHYFLLGVFFFLLLFAVGSRLPLASPRMRRFLRIYHIGLNLTVVLLAARGIAQVLALPLASAVRASLSGVAGIGHLLLGGSFLAILFEIRRHALRRRSNDI